MVNKQKKWSAGVKFEIALHAIKGEMTINEICSRYTVAPSQVHAWRKQLLEQGVGIFSKSNKPNAAGSAEECAQSKLYEKIGQLTMERDFLKKCWGRFQEPNDKS